MNVAITPESLNKSFVKYRKELLTMPVYALNKVLPYMTCRFGIRYKEVVGELSGDMQLAPYKVRRHDDSDVNIKGRTLETFLGNCVKGFNPNAVVDSIYGSDIVMGEGLKNVPITKQVAAYLMAKLGEHLYQDLFTAQRDENGDTTATLFNGFKTIAESEITGGAIAEANGNLKLMAAAPTEADVIDFFEEFVDAADEKLTDQKCYLLVPRSYKRMYERAYRSEHGSLNYNNEFKKTYLDGEPNVEIVGLGNVPAGYMQLSTKENVLIGLNLRGEEERFNVEKALDSHFLLDFVAAMFFGCQFESISKERLLIGKVSA